MARRASEPARVGWPAGLLAALALVAGLPAGCSDEPPPGLTGAYGFSALVFVQRAHAPNAGSLVAPQRPRSGARLVLLEPAAPSGRLIPLVDLPSGDLLGLDVAPDGRRLVVALRADAADRFHLVELDIAAVRSGSRCLEPDGDLGPACRRLTFGPADDTGPVYLPDGRVAFVRADAEQALDFEGRGPARGLWTVEADGSRVVRLDYGPGHDLGASQLPDGWLRAVRWTERDGQAIFQPARIDPSSSRGFEPDGEPTGPTGLPLDAIADPQGRIMAACVPSLGTWAAGTLCQFSKERDSYLGVLGAIPAGAGCSPEGRLRGPVPLGQGRFLASYAMLADGCLTIADGDRGRQPDFGIAEIDVADGERLPVYNDPDRDELMARPVRERALLDPGVGLPARPDAGCDRRAVDFEGLVGAEQTAAGAVRLRVLQPLSGAEAPWAVELGGRAAAAVCRDPGGQQAVASIQADGSFRLRAPAGVGLRLQTLDRYGAALASEPLLRGGVPCARRRCAACHENDGQAPDFETSLAAALAPEDLAGGPEAQRDFDFQRDIQPILNRSCALAGCHDAETAAGNYVDLSGNLRGLDLHEAAAGRTSVAYRSLLFVDRRRADPSGRVVEQTRPYVEPGQARASRLIQKLGVPCRYDCADAPAWAPWAMPAAARHPEDQPGFAGELTDADRWLLVEWIDAGAPFWGRGATP